MLPCFIIVSHSSVTNFAILCYVQARLPVDNNPESSSNHEMDDDISSSIDDQLGQLTLAENDDASGDGKSDIERDAAFADVSSSGSDDDNLVGTTTGNHIPFSTYLYAPFTIMNDEAYDEANDSDWVPNEDDEDQSESDPENDTDSLSGSDLENDFMITR